MKLREQLAEIKSFTSAQAQALTADLEAAISTSAISRANSLLTAAVAETTAEISRVTAEVRRQAILHGLSSLDYEVREGMTTAFARGEAVVVHGRLGRVLRNQDTAIKSYWTGAYLACEERYSLCGSSLCQLMPHSQHCSGSKRKVKFGCGAATALAVMANR